ncbi:MAG: hypothetical protein RR014_02105, partial [Bilophila sp.]
THLLLDDATREQLFAERRPAPPVESPPPRHPAPPPPRPQATPPAQQRQAPPLENALPTQARQAPPRPETAPPQDTPPPAQEMSVPAALPPARWSAYWQDRLARTPSHPALVWTYPALSQDLGGAADEAHRDFLRRLIGDMALPKGSHAFWPLNSYPYAPGESETTVNAAMFMSGVSTLNPDTVILMSGVVPPALGIFGGEKLTQLRPLMPAIVQGRRFVVTPHVDGLIQDQRRYAQLISFLKAILSGR